MIRQKSFENEQSTLYLVPTPIGNLQEMTPRALEVLNSVDVIACEDTRNSGQLLKHFSIHKRLIACQNFNEDSSCRGIVKLLEEGKNVALISDAGYPLINDPGQKVVSHVTEAGYNVVPVSGCSAFLNALVASGLVAQPFLFVGFLPSGSSECRKKAELYKDYPMTLIFYEAPHRIEKTLRIFLEVFGDRKCTLARELTKVHEEFLRGTVSEILEVAKDLKGEMVLVLEGNKEEVTLSDEELVSRVEKYVQEGMKTSMAIKEVSRETGVSKNRVYELVHQR